MYRIHLLVGVLVLTTCSFGQQPDTSRNPNSDTYYRDTNNRPVEYSHGYGNWGLLGLLGLTGLLGRRRRETVLRDRDEYTTEQRRRTA